MVDVCCFSKLDFTSRKEKKGLKARTCLRRVVGVRRDFLRLTNGSQYCGYSTCGSDERQSSRQDVRTLASSSRLTCSWIGACSTLGKHLSKADY
jgi:hypothetical protein